jgi:hypothetical protein
LQGCGLFKAKKVQKLTIKWYQFGNEFLIIKNGKSRWIKPCKNCIILKNQGSKKLCLKPVPDIKPHIKVIEINSKEVKLEVLSLFKEILLFVWKEKEKPDLKNARLISPGIAVLKDLKLGETYFIAGTVKYGKNLFGPLSKAIKLKYEDRVPPEPPEGGGYFIEGDKVVLIWNKSKSSDVVEYVVERDGKRFKVKKNTFSEKLPGKEVVYRVRAVDRGGNESKPFEIEVKSGEGVKK